MYKSNSGFKIIKEPCEEVKNLVYKEITNHKYVLNPIHDYYIKDWFKKSESITPTLPISKLYWVKHQIDKNDEFYMLIGQDMT